MVVSLYNGNANSNSHVAYRIDNDVNDLECLYEGHFWPF